jgi:hypothetical protein
MLSCKNISERYVRRSIQMSLFKEEMAEFLRVRQAMSGMGYFVSHIQKSMGHKDVVIHARMCRPGEHDAQIAADKARLEALPDTTDSDAYDAIRRSVLDDTDGSLNVI